MGEYVEENLQGCYLLYNVNPKYKGQVYLGYTVDPRRRIRQHNNGIKAGGAKRTSRKAPWEMVLIIHGFPSTISALQFEWAWQKPLLSTRLRHVKSKKGSESAFEYKFRVVSEMLRTGPWTRLPLCIRWLKPEYSIDFSPRLRPPPHMPIVYGPVTSKKVKPPASNECDDEDTGLCVVCKNHVETSSKLTCIHPDCPMQSHITCLAGLFTNDEYLLPIEGQCPTCESNLLWGHLIRHKQGCYQDLSPPVS